MENELRLPSEWPEDFTYTDEGGLTPEQVDERRNAGRGFRPFQKVHGDALGKIHGVNVGADVRAETL